MLKRTVFVDMDGVLTDFVRGALEVHGKTLDRKDVCWNFYEKLGLTEEEFIAPFGEEFWAKLPWTIEGPTLIDAIQIIFEPHEVAILTAPLKTKGCIEGKLRWVEKHLPAFADQTFTGRTKQMLAHPGAVLIDDKDENCELFAKAGGQAILVPRPWNKRKAETDRRGDFDVLAFDREISRRIR